MNCDIKSISILTWADSRSGSLSSSHASFRPVSGSEIRNDLDRLVWSGEKLAWRLKASLEIAFEVRVVALSCEVCSSVELMKSDYLAFGSENSLFATEMHSSDRLKYVSTNRGGSISFDRDALKSAWEGKERHNLFTLVLKMVF